MKTSQYTGTVPAAPARRHDIDWLRIIAVLLLFPFHTARIFNLGEDFYVRNAAASKSLSYVVEFLNPWHMPLLFLLAGASTWFALSYRGAGGYTVERLKRLLVPFILGFLVIVPPQSYLGLVSHGGVDAGSFFSWWPSFFHSNAADPGGYFLGGRTFGHLWFILHLFFYSLLALPIVLFLRHRTGKRVTGWLAKVAQRRGVILLFALFLCVAIPFPDMYGGNPVYLGTFFLLGYLLMSDTRFERAIDRHKLAALLLGFIPGLGIAYLEVRGWPALSPFAGSLADFAHYLLIPWFCLIALLGYGRRFLSFSNRFLKYAAQASYPVYLLHQTVIVAVGFVVLKAGIGIPLSYAAILVGSLTGSFVIYDVVVRRLNLVRFLFGMKALKKRPAVVPPVLEPGSARPVPDRVLPTAVGTAHVAATLLDEAAARPGIVRATDGGWRAREGLPPVSVLPTDAYPSHHSTFRLGDMR